MKRLFGALGACAVLAMAGAVGAAKAPAGPAGPLWGTKLAVADFDRATDYYSKFFGAKKIDDYNEHERGLTLGGPPGGSNIVLWLDNCGKMGANTPTTISTVC